MKRAGAARLAKPNRLSGLPDDRERDISFLRVGLLNFRRNSAGKSVFHWPVLRGIYCSISDNSRGNNDSPVSRLIP